MRKNFIRLIAIVAMLLLPALALADEFAVVKGGRLNLRQYPSTSSTSLGKYSTGTWVIVGSSNGNGWRSVRTLDGKQGYMSENYLDFGANASTGTVKYANGGYVNLRNGPSLSYGVAMRVTSGTTVTIIDDSYEWNRVGVNANGTAVTGYMHESFISRGTTSTATVTTQYGGKVNVRSGPSSSYGSIGSLRTGSTVTILLRGNGWYQISVGGVTGFMASNYLSSSSISSGSSSSSSSSGSSSNVTSYTTAYVNNPLSTQVLNLREQPSQSSLSIGQYRNGTQVKVVSYGSTWCEVYVGTRHGYMMTRYLSFGSSPVTPTVTPTPTPLVQLITPQPTTTSSGPKAGTEGTLAVSAGSGSTIIGVYTDSTLRTLKATYAPGQKMTILNYTDEVCMILVNGELGYVSTWNVNY